MRYRCVHCAAMPHGLIFEAWKNECPKCGRSGYPHVYPLVDIHFVVFSKNGPINSDQHGRQLIACQPRRDAMARNRRDHFAATDHPPAVTCPACKRSREYVTVMRKMFADDVAAEEQRKAGGLILGRK